VKKSRFSEEKIIAVLKQWEAGVKPTELTRKHGVSEATLYNWKARYGGLDVSQLRRLKELEVENARLKKMYAELSLAHHALQDAVEKSYSAGGQERAGGSYGL
jgi:putative transposase